mmetsp:Transcript_20908/g.37042  ORF Transcript_20908/g.37042 Transcript_20908/m.37042 type:complete len:101 (-) Transcript_20908:234-536(-)
MPGLSVMPRQLQNSTGAPLDFEADYGMVYGLVALVGLALIAFTFLYIRQRRTALNDDIGLGDELDAMEDNTVPDVTVEGSTSNGQQNRMQSGRSVELQQI